MRLSIFAFNNLLCDKNGQPFFSPYGLIILIGLFAIIGIKAFIGNQQIADQRRASSVSLTADPLCIKQPDNEAVATCHAHWKAKGGNDPLDILSGVNP